MNSNIKILVVDDEAAILNSLQAYLEDEDYNVSTAASAEEAMEMISQQQFNIGLFDIRLPGMSGDTLALQTKQAYPDMEILFHTGFLQYRIPRELKDIGFTYDHIINKPIVDMNDLVSKIQKLFSKKQK